MITGAASSQLMHQKQLVFALHKERNMNKDNYCSLGMCKKLVEAGIVLETEVVFVKLFEGHKLRMKDSFSFREEDDYIPAPSMAELWRELPETLDVVDVMKPHSYIRMTKFQGETVTGYGCQLDVGKRINPSDSLADLLIWVKKENVF
jgi:hypothetical protein